MFCLYGDEVGTPWLAISQVHKGGAFWVEVIGHAREASSSGNYLLLMVVSKLVRRGGWRAGTLWRALEAKIKAEKSSGRLGELRKGV